MSKEKGNISAFQRYLTVWVILCMVIGVLIGKYLPIIPSFLNSNGIIDLVDDLSNDDESGFSKHKRCW